MLEGMKRLSVWLFPAFLLILAPLADALARPPAGAMATFAKTAALPLATAADVIVVYNKKAKGSKGVARHYAAVRGVPKDNLVGVSLPDTEAVGEALNRRHMAALVGPVKKRRDALLKAGRHPIVLLTYGIPLKVRGAE